MKSAERIVLVLILIIVIGSAAWMYFTLQHQHQEVLDGVARGDYEIPLDDTEPEVSDDWRRYYPVTVPITIGGVPVRASVADTIPERIKGLSDTPYLPEDVVKLFAFEAPGAHSIWMKDMNYSLDIIWVEQDGRIVHTEENIAPETFPESFASPTPAWFVIETNAGFVASNEIVVGDEVVIPE